MIKKILWFLLILLVLYIIGIFLFPKFVDEVWSKDFNDSVRNFKGKVDEIYTNLPTKEEVKDIYEKTLSWTEVIKSNVVDWINSVKWWIDNVRENVNEITEKYEEIKTSVDEAKEKFEEWVDKVKDVTETINWVLQSSGSIDEEKEE
jgi:methyl-accepting chemotaxis protein